MGVGKQARNFIPQSLLPSNHKSARNFSSEAISLSMSPQLCQAPDWIHLEAESPWCQLLENYCFLGQENRIQRFTNRKESSKVLKKRKKKKIDRQNVLTFGYLLFIDFICNFLKASLKTNRRRDGDFSSFGSHPI